MKLASRCVWALVLGVGVLGLGGCKCLTGAEYDELVSFKTLSDYQKSRLLTLTEQMDGCATERDGLKAQVGQLRDSAQTSSKMVDGTTKVVKTLSQTVEDLRRRNRELAEGMRERSPVVRQLPAGAEVISSSEGVGLRFPGDLLFNSGQTALKTSSKTMLASAAAFLKENQGKVRIKGFTDSVPIKKSGFRSNLHLSTMRALSMVEELAKAGVPASRMHVAGYGEHALMREGGKEVKYKSRRVEIWLLNPDQ